MATVLVTATLGTVTFRLGVGPSILAIAILMVRRWDRKRVGGAGSHAPTCIHGIDGAIKIEVKRRMIRGASLTVDGYVWHFAART